MSARQSAEKAALRSLMVRRRESLTAAAAQRRSAQITLRVTALQAWWDARFIHTYVDSLTNEVPTAGLIEASLAAGRRIAVPWVDPGLEPPFKSAEIRALDELQPGPWGLLQPPGASASWVADDVFDLVVVPGVAFDRRGYRIGHGGGFYDVFLSGLAATSVGLICAKFLLDEAPSEAQDIPVDIVVTETATHRCQRRDN